jgi:hypothetical protein
VIRFL